MTDVLSIALSGLNAASARANAAASNIAGADTTGALPGTGGPAPYAPVDVVQTSVQAGPAPQGTRAQTVERQPSSVPSFEPDAPYADENGFVAAPNVDLGTEIVDLKQAAQAYEANAAVVRTESQMEKELFDRFDQTV